LKITENLPTISFPTTKVEIPNDKELSDPTFNISGPIDMLIGAQNYWELVKGELQLLGRNKPWLVPTSLGCVLSGPLARSYNSERPKTFVLSRTDCFIRSTNSKVLGIGRVW
jgi:hypothetical protein